MLSTTSCRFDNNNGYTRKANLLGAASSVFAFANEQTEPVMTLPTCFLFLAAKIGSFASTPGRASPASPHPFHHFMRQYSCHDDVPRLAATVLTLCYGASPVDAFQSVATPARPITALSAAQGNSNDEAVSTLGGVRGLAAAFTLFAMTTLSGPAGAVSGGGLDYANLDITGQNFSNEAKAYKGKDFSVSV